MKYVPCGNFADKIISLVAEKQRSGYSYETMERVLKQFDKFSAEQFPDKKVLDKEIVMEWGCMKQYEGPVHFQNRASAIRELARFIIRSGEEAYLLPSGIGRKPQKRIPHIYSDEEMVLFFKQADALHKPFNLPSIRHLAAPVIFRLLYSCGLRPGEALRLKRYHVNFETGILFIEESKGHKDRNVAMSEEMTDLMKKFDIMASVFAKDRTYFFPKPDGNGYSLQWLEKLFQEIWAGSDLSMQKRPRLYDFRHTFATKCMLKWISEGKNLYAMLPYLSTYMGHECYSDTAYYIHLTQAYDCWSVKQYSPGFNDIIPEV